MHKFPAAAAAGPGPHFENHCSKWQALFFLPLSHPNVATVPQNEIMLENLVQSGPWLAHDDPVSGKLVARI